MIFINWSGVLVFFPFPLCLYHCKQKGFWFLVFLQCPRSIYTRVRIHRNWSFLFLRCFCCDLRLGMGKESGGRQEASANPCRGRPRDTAGSLLPYPTSGGKKRTPLSPNWANMPLNTRTWAIPLKFRESLLAPEVIYAHRSMDGESLLAQPPCPHFAQVP